MQQPDYEKLERTRRRVFRTMFLIILACFVLGAWASFFDNQHYVKLFSAIGITAGVGLILFGRRITGPSEYQPLDSDDTSAD